MQKPWTAAALTAALIVGGAVTAAGQQARPVTLQAPDGVSLKATYFAAGKPGPGILLLHQCNRDRTAWTQLATAAASGGFNVLALDFRGYGESGGPRFKTFQEQRPTMQEKWPGDVEAAIAWLMAQGDVDRERLAFAGASCSVHQAIYAAQRHPEVKTLVLLSGDTSAEGRAYLAKAEQVPLFAAASRNDGNVVDLMRWTVGFSRNPHNTFTQFKAAGHGTDMFAVEQRLEPAILDWLDARLRNAPATAPAVSTTLSKPTVVEEFWTALTGPGGLDRAWRIYDVERRRRNPKVVLFPELEMNTYGYRRLQAGHADEAVAIFRMNADAYPRSANACDSLSEALIAAGERKDALGAAEEGLKLLGRDKTMAEELKTLLRESLGKKVRELK